MELDTLSIKMSRINEIMLKSNISQNDLNGNFDFQSTFREDGKVQRFGSIQKKNKELIKLATLNNKLKNWQTIDQIDVIDKNNMRRDMLDHLEIIQKYKDKFDSKFGTTKRIQEESE